MDWFWRSKPSKSHEASEIDSSSSSKASTSMAAPALASATEPAKPTLSREERANQEFLELMKEFQAETEVIPEKNTGETKSTRASFGGQFVNIYRYGSFRSCSNHWDDFWLCMRTRNWDAKDRAAAIQDHYRKRAMKWKTGPSSEDVWDVRTEPVKDSFQGNLDELEAAIAAWRKANPNAVDPWEQHQQPAFNTQTSA
ncbi:hypothetical protein LTS17_007485 [Exophiala oligosperma]